ncbi:hypothetical protein GCM10010172_06810 [Paractinoplanes ferrugineus]|uniref:Phage tail tape measure protein domain-containing protein n=1 Tax=Paractinoplanes ferrugineus TaxID=113564 RepID=A0A919MDY3_9ACTN|nr:phage tail tape measure protein [Actinoplanes ferrugineus]GIE16291.1 hypothetical protein Afe05nite_81310 [Actinoplanes ferrugineus]
MVALASAFVRIRPSTDKREFQKTGGDVGKAAGDAAAKGFNDQFTKGTDGRIRDSKGRFVKDGEDAGRGAGEGFGEQFTRGSDGRLRDSRGKFVKDSEAAGRSGGSKAGDAFSFGFGDRTKKLASQLGANLKLAAGVFVPLGLAGAVAQIGKIGIAYEDNLNIFKTVSKATGKQMDEVADKARALGADVTLPGVSAAGAAAAMTELAKAGFTVQESMDAAQGTLQLARIANISEADAAEIAANAVNAFGIEAKDTGKVVDQLAAAANSSSIEVTEASASFKQAAAVFSGLQGAAVGPQEAITELNTAIAILGNNGIKGSDAGTSLKQALLQLTGPSGPAKAAMISIAQAAQGANITLDQQKAILYGNANAREKAINAIDKMNPKLANSGDIAYDAAGKMRPLKDIIDLVTRGTKDMTQEDRNMAITKIFGADATRSILALMKGGLPVYEQQRQAILQQGAAADVAKAKNAGLGGAIDNVKSQFENAAIAIYNQVKGPLTSGLNAIAGQLPTIFGYIGTFASFIRDNIGTIRDWALAIGAVTIALKINSTMLAIQAAGGVVKAIQGIGIITRITQGWAAAQALLNATLIANPIGVVIVAITALIAGLVLLYRHNQAFRNIVQAVWAAIKSAIAATVNWITGTAWPAIVSAWNAIAAAAKWLYQNVILPVWNAIKAVIDFVVKAVTLYIQALITEWKILSGAAMWLWHNIFQPVFGAIQKIVEIWWLAVRVAFAAFVKIVQAVLGPVITWLGNMFSSVFAWIQARVAQWWQGMKILFDLFKAYVLGPVVGAIQTTLGFFQRIFAAIGVVVANWWSAHVRPYIELFKIGWAELSARISGVWNNGIKPIFAAFISFVRDKVVGGFSTAVSAITGSWDKVKEAARKPVAFVVNQVINPFINGLNKAASVVGVKDRVEPIKGFATGGQIPGRPSLSDNMLASITGTGRPLAVASGEFITNTRSTLANLPLVKAINAKRGKVTRADIDPYLDGNDGPGVGDGIGDSWNRIVGGAKGALSFVTNPAAALRKAAEAVIARVPGAGMLRDTVVGSARRTINGAVDFIKDKLSFGGGIGGEGVFGGWQGMRQLIHNRFPDLNMISGFRQGATTLTGNRSYHAIGRAVDYPPVRALAEWIRSTFGSKTKELITPWQDLNLNNGQPHTYTGAVWNQHNFPGGNAHVHWAAKHGGLVSAMSGMPIRLFDQGGFWPSGTLGANLSGRTEYVNPDGAGAAGITVIVQPGAFNGAVIANEKQAEDMVVKGFTSAVRSRRITAASIGARAR